MKKAIAIVVVVLLILLLGVGWHYSRNPGDGDERGSIARTGDAPGAPETPLATKLAGKQVALPAWFAQPGALGRRVAGVVLFDGAPVAGATVRIGVDPSGSRADVPAMSPGPPFVQVLELKTGGAGTFDFGELPAVHIVVSAEATGKAPVSVGVALANPRETPAPDHLVLMLGDCRSRVLGTVRDSASPIAHARLKVAGLAMVESDARGAFAVCMPQAKYPNIRVEADGYGTINVQVPPMYGDLHRDFILVPEATIAGIVVDESGAPIASAVVSARPALSDAQDEASSVDTIADDSGRFQLSGLAPTKYGLGAFSAEGQTTEHPIIVAIAGSTANRDVRLVIARRARLRGRVMMAGKPVAGAHVGVELGLFSARHSAWYVSSQEDGSFVLDGIGFGTFTPNVFPYEVVSPKSVVVDRGEPAEVTIEVAAKATVRGRVTRKGVPVVARVECNPGGAVTESGADGTYVLEGLGTGRFRMYAQNQKAFTDHPVTLVTGDQTVDLELESGGEVQGVVVDEAGAPVSGVMVHLDSVDDNDSCGSMTDAAGNFECATLTGHIDYRPTVYPSVVQQGHPYKPASGDSFALVRVENGDSIVRGVRLAIKHDQLAIRGKVVDDSGATIPDARVTLLGSQDWGDPSRTRADDGGGFVIEALAPGRYSLRARRADGSVGEVHAITAGTSGVEIKLVRPGAIAGTLAGFTGTVWVLAGIELRGETDVHEGKVDGDRFTISGLKPGNYTVQALVDGVQLDGAAVDVRAGATATVALRARPRATIEGRVNELGGGAPIADMACRVSLVMGGREGAYVSGVRIPLTDANGRFSISAPVGRVRVTCSFNSSTWSDAGGDFDVAATGSTSVEVFAVKQVSPPSNPGFGLQPTVVPPTVSAVIPKSEVAAGDQLVTIDGTLVTNLSPGAAMMLASNHRSGTPLVLQVVRAGNPLTLRIAIP